MSAGTLKIYVNNSLQKTLGHTAKTFASTFTSDSASPLVTSLTLTVSLGTESVSV